jgi:hypothetical protein
MLHIRLGGAIFLMGACTPDADLLRVDARVEDSGYPIDTDAGGEVDAGSEPDAGSEVDAGSEPDAGGEVDAGSEPDAGINEDAGGQTDAGVQVEECQLPGRAGTPFTCQGDEDWCDPRGDIGGLTTLDVLGVWSRIEGTDFVIEIRTADTPFRQLSQMLGVRLHDGLESFDLPPVGNLVCIEPVVAPCQVVFVLYGFISRGFPPQEFARYPELESHFDECSQLFVSRSEAAVQLRFPLSESEIERGYLPRYTVVSQMNRAPNPTDYAPDGVNLEEMRLTSRGGRLLVDDFVSLCEIQCATWDE